MGASIWSFPGAVALNCNLSPSSMQSIICTSCGLVFSRRRGLTRPCHSTHAHLHWNCSNHSLSDGLDYKVADDIPHVDDNKQIRRPAMEIFLITGAPIDDTVRVLFFEDDDWDAVALFATPQQWQLCCSIVDTNLGKAKLNNILQWRLIVPDANAKALISAINSLQTWTKWMASDANGRRVLLILKENQLRCSIGTPLQRYGIS